jgi:DNA-binding MarR family transcriptional regulator
MLGMASTSRSSSGRSVDPTLVAQWREMLERHALVSGALEKALQREHGIGLSEFETLDRLADADRGKYRMLDLAKDIHLSQSALSRTVDRLAKDGLVQRSTCTEDRRGVYVCLTDKGRQVYDEALPVHREVLRATWEAPAADQMDQV